MFINLQPNYIVQNTFTNACCNIKIFSKTYMFNCQCNKTDWIDEKDKFDFQNGSEWYCFWTYVYKIHKYYWAKEEYSGVVNPFIGIYQALTLSASTLADEFRVGHLLDTLHSINYQSLQDYLLPFLLLSHSITCPSNFYKLCIGWR
jgi:hypothetical protein